jgi:cephalosporin hydroxylase
VTTAANRASITQRLKATAVGRAVRRKLRPAGAMPPNPLSTYFENNQGRLIHKWLHYLPIYDRHFAPYRDKPVTVLEFGVNQGGSLQMWKHYFGPGARIIGVDIDQRCAALGEEQIEIVIGDQEDRQFLRDLGEKIGEVDILIEDGGHTMTQQIATFEEFWPRIRTGGVLLMEDLQTSYWPKYGGGHKKPETFIEFAKNLIDQQHAWHSRDPESLEIDDYTRTIAGMHVYSGIIVFDKADVRRPTNKKVGTPSFPK